MQSFNSVIFMFELAESEGITYPSLFVLPLERDRERELTLLPSLCAPGFEFFPLFHQCPLMELQCLQSIAEFICFYLSCLSPRYLSIQQCVLFLSSLSFLSYLSKISLDFLSSSWLLQIYLHLLYVSFHLSFTGYKCLSSSVAYLTKTLINRLWKVYGFISIQHLGSGSSQLYLLFASAFWSRALASMAFQAVPASGQMSLQLEGLIKTDCQVLYSSLTSRSFLKSQPKMIIQLSTKLDLQLDSFLFVKYYFPGSILLLYSKNFDNLLSKLAYETCSQLIIFSLHNLTNVSKGVFPIVGMQLITAWLDTEQVLMSSTSILSSSSILV